MRNESGQLGLYAVLRSLDPPTAQYGEETKQGGVHE